MRLVRFHLAEVRVDGAVQCERILDDGLDVDPDAAVARLSERRLFGVEEAGTSVRAVGDRLQVAPRRDLAQPLEGAKLRDEAREALGHERPGGLLVGAADVANERDTPGLSRCAREPQAAERNRDPHDVAVRGQPAVRVPYGVEAVVVILSFGHDPVELDAVGIRLKQVCALAVVERVEVQGDAVVHGDLFPPRQAGADFRRVVLTDEDHVEVGVVVAEIRRGGSAHRHPVTRLALPKVRRHRGAGGRTLPEEIVEPRRLRDALHDDARGSGRGGRGRGGRGRARCAVPARRLRAERRQAEQQGARPDDANDRRP